MNNQKNISLDEQLKIGNIVSYPPPTLMNYKGVIVSFEHKSNGADVQVRWGSNVFTTDECLFNLRKVTK